MKVFWDEAQKAHKPEFFLQKGKVRKNFEVPARADALLDACIDMRMEILDPPEIDLLTLRQVHTPDYLGFLRDGPHAWAALPDPGDEVVANIHPTPEMMANGDGNRLPHANHRNERKVIDRKSDAGRSNFALRVAGCCFR